MEKRIKFNPDTQPFYVLPLKYSTLYTSSIEAGITLGIAGFLFLSIFQFTFTFPAYLPFIKILSAIAFSYGLLDIVINKRCLYTGKIGLINVFSKTNWLQVLLCLMANLITLTVVACCVTLLVPGLIPVADSLVEAKLAQTWYQLLLNGIGCGIFMYLAVTANNLFITSFSVVGFILCGFEHCLADWFYFYVSSYAIPVVPFLLILLGNTIGANIIRLIKGEL